jgi:hypothetical protein
MSLPRLQQKVDNTCIECASVLLGLKLFDVVQTRENYLEQLASEFPVLSGLIWMQRRFARNDSGGVEARTLIISFRGQYTP